MFDTYGFRTVTLCLSETTLRVDSRTLSVPRQAVWPWTSLPVLNFQAAAGHGPVERRHLERGDLQNFSLDDLTALSKSLSQTIQGNHQPHHNRSSTSHQIPSSPVCPLLTTRPEFRAGDPPAGTRPAEDGAGRHAAGGPGSHVPLKQPQCFWREEGALL